MENKNAKHSVGTICFLPHNDIKDVLITVEKLCSNLDEHWRILIVTSTPQRMEENFKDINKICKGSPFLEHLIVKEGLENQIVCPTAIKVINAIKYVKTQYISFVDGRHFPNIVGLTNTKKVLDQQADLGGVRGSVQTLNSKKDCTEHLLKNQLFDVSEGINQFGLSGLSPIGTVYNIPFLLESEIFDSLQDNVHDCLDAPRSSFYSSAFTYLNILIATEGRTGLSSELVFQEIEI